MAHGTIICLAHACRATNATVHMCYKLHAKQVQVQVKGKTYKRLGIRMAQTLKTTETRSPPTRFYLISANTPH